MDYCYTVFPNIEPAPPQLSNPSKISAVKVFPNPGSFSYSNKIADPNFHGVGYYAKAGVALGQLNFSDMDLSGTSPTALGMAGLLRMQNGTVDTINMTRIRLLHGAYAPGVAAGLFNLVGADAGVINFTDCDVQRDQPITSSGDIYGVLCTGSGHDKDGNPFGSAKEINFTRCRATGGYTNYNAGDTSYPNDDLVSLEKSILKVRFTDCDLRGTQDACIDSKAIDCSADRTIVGGGRENMKFFSSAHHGHVISCPPNNFHCLISTPTGGQPIEAIYDVHEVLGFDPVTNEPADPNLSVIKFERDGGIYRGLTALYRGFQPGQVLARLEASAVANSQIWLGDKQVPITGTTVLMPQ
jgi:hypothetical protein